MKNKYLETGKIVGTHGVRGMVRVQAWADNGEFLKKFKRFYLDNMGSKSLEVIEVKPANTVVLIKFKGVDSVPEAEALRNTVIYIDRKDAKLPKGSYFIADLIGCGVYNFDDNCYLGTITEVSSTGANDVWHIEKDGKEYLFPAVKEMIDNIDIDNEKVVIKPIKGIFDDEN